MQPFFKSIQINNLLSFGPDSPPIELGPLNVIIGTNGSGKSNLFDVLALLKNAPGDINKPINDGESELKEWFWKTLSADTKPANIEVNIFLSQADFSPVRHFLSFSGEKKIALKDESIGGHKPPLQDAESQELFNPMLGTNSPEDYYTNLFYGRASDGLYYVQYIHNKPYPAPQSKGDKDQADITKDTRPDIKNVILQVILPDVTGKTIYDQIPAPEVLIAGGIMLDSTISESPPASSVLARYTDRKSYPVFCEISDKYKNIHIYNNWSYGRKSSLRRPQKASLSDKWLNEDGTNLFVVLKKIKNNEESYSRYLKFLKQLYEDVNDFEIIELDNLISIRLVEGERRIPVARLSDGTLRYLMLLAVLCDPEPPAVVCIEEPEMGLHPDLVHVMAEALQYAAERTQVIVTTHSVRLVDCFTPTPEVIQVCEKHEGQTYIERLDPEELKPWLENYRLGDLWSSGGIGGNRW